MNHASNAVPKLLSRMPKPALIRLFAASFYDLVVKNPVVLVINAVSAR